MKHPLPDTVSTAGATPDLMGILRPNLFDRKAMHTLIGPRHVLHRSTPFVQFEDLSDAVPKNLLPLNLDHRSQYFMSSV